MDQFQNIEHTLQTFFSNDNNTRKQAEQYLDRIPSVNFEAGIDYFLMGIELQSPQLSELAAVYLKKKYIDDEEKMLQLTPEKQQLIVTKVQNSITGERHLLYLKRAFEIIVKLYSIMKQEDNLMNLISALEANEDKKIKQALLYLIEIICEYSFDDEYLMKYAENLSRVFQANLLHQDVEIRVCAFKSLTVFLANISDERLVNKFSSVFPILLSKSMEIIQADEESAKTALSSLNDLIETHPKFVRPILDDLINIFTQIMKAKTLNEQVRIQALSGINILSTTSPSLIRKNNQFKTQTVQAFFQMMTEIDNLDLKEWNEELSDQILSNNDPASAAQEALGQISKELTTKFLIKLYDPMIMQGLVSQEWQHQHAALMTIAMLSEGCSEFFKEDLSDLDQIMKLIKPLTGSNNPRIIYDVMTAYSLLCSEFAPQIQEKYHQEIMQLNLSALTSQYIKLQFRAIQSCINFAQSLISEDEEAHNQLITPYTQYLIPQLHKILLDPPKQTQFLPELLTLISTLASLLKADFGPYYQSFTQPLMTLVTSNTQELTLKIKAIETMGFVITSLPEDSNQFQQDAVELMKILGQVQKDDPLLPSILVVFGQIAECLKEKFVEFMGIFPRVLEACNIDIQCESDEQKEEEQSKYVKKTFDLGMFGGKKILKLNTSSLEQKIEGFNCLEVLAESLGASFFPYIEESLKLIQQYFSYTHGKEIRRAAVRILPHLLKACQNDDQRAQIINQTAEPIFKELRLQVQNGQNAEAITFILNELDNSLKTVKTPVLQQNFVQTCIDLVAKSLKACNALKKEILQNYENDEMDEELQEKIDEELNEVNEILVCVMEISGTILKLYKNVFENTLINTILPDFFNVYNSKSATNSEINSACCIFCDFFDHASYPKLMPIFLNLGLNKDDIDIQQTVGYGIGAIAKRLPQNEFQAYLGQSLCVLQKILTHHDINNKDRLSCTETAIGALGKIACFQAQQEDVLVKFLSYLPLKDDEEESQNIHNMLFTEVLKKNQLLVNRSQGTLQNLQQTIIRIRDYANSTNVKKIIDEESKELLQKILNQ